jgi:uncharacterized membrane protein
MSSTGGRPRPDRAPLRIENSDGTGKGDRRYTSWIARFGAMQRLGTALVIAAAAFLLQPDSIAWHTRAVASWDLGAFAYLGLAWALIAQANAKATRDHALSQDQSGYVIFLFVVGAACASIVAIGFVVGTIRDLSFWPRAWHLALTVAALLSSWLLIQTVFAFHYAHRYYTGPHVKAGTNASLLFPGGREPDYIDFAYYSLVVGMTSQVSDVAISSRSMRRLTMVHGVLAFLFNIAVLALSINIIASAT